MANESSVGDEGVDSARSPRKRASAGTRRRRLVTWVAIGAVALVLVTASLIYTEQSSFCPTCHEMGPYYQAWSSGHHVGRAQCVDCHIDAGFIAHIAHKPSEMKELWDHFFANNRFPNFTVDVPNSRCVRCHEKVPDKIGALFSHALHQTKATCKDCHSQTGHIVTLASLDAAGILKSNASTQTVAGMTPSSIVGHKKVICQNCHDQARMRCSSCHQPPHEDRGECSNCHIPGASFALSHSADSNCAACHTAPANHFGSDCKACHTPGVPFKNATFAHPATQHDYRSIVCARCHPNGFATAYCSCHPGGVAPRD